MIVRIATEGQFELDQADYETVNDLDNQCVEAVAEGQVVAGEQLAAILEADLHEATHLLGVITADQRPDLRLRVQRVADLQPPGPFRKGRCERVVRLVLHQDPRLDDEDGPLERAAGEVEEASAGYSIMELFSVGSTATQLQLDVFHSPHYVIPFTSIPMVVTIHDLTHLKVPVWRKHPLAPLYARRMIGRAVKKSTRIITGSEAVRTSAPSDSRQTRSRRADACELSTAPVASRCVP